MYKIGDKTSAEEIYKRLKLVQPIWYDQNFDFVFRKNFAGWSWSFCSFSKNQEFKAKTEQALTQRNGFKLRADAVFYVDAMFKTNIAQSGLSRGVDRAYTFDENLVHLMPAKGGWKVGHLSKKHVSENNVVKIFASRLDALSYLVEHRPDYFWL